MLWSAINIICIFTDKETEALRLSNLLKVKSVVGDVTGSQTYMVYSFRIWILTTILPA